MKKLEILSNPILLDTLNSSQKTWTSIEIEYLTLVGQGNYGIAKFFLVGVLLDSYRFLDDEKSLEELSNDLHQIPFNKYIQDLKTNPTAYGVYKRYFKSYTGLKINCIKFDYSRMFFSYRGSSFSFSLSYDVSGFFRWYDNKLRSRLKDSLSDYEKPDPAFFTKLHKVKSNKITQEDLREWIK